MFFLCVRATSLEYLKNKREITMDLMEHFCFLFFIPLVCECAYREDRDDVMVQLSFG